MTFNFDIIKFNGVPCNTFTLEDLKAFVDDTNTKRLCYSMDGQKNPWGPGNGDVKKWFNAPYANSIKPIMDRLAGVSLRIKQNEKCCYPCTDDEEVNAIEKFIDDHKEMVFMRDYLDLSISLAMHQYTPDGKRTEIGELEYLVKYCDDTDRSTEKASLAANLQKALDELPFFKLADYVCAIPGRKTFVNDIIEQLKGFDFENISSSVSWAHKQDEIKNAEDGKQKLDLLDKSGLTIDEDVDLQGKNVLLIDDLYSSGLTIQYVAMKLKERGARRVFGITFVKALRNS